MLSFSQIISRAYFGLAAAALSIAAAQPAQAQPANASFFVTSVGIGNGGNLGGLAGADNYCQTLAQAAGAGSKTWRAYLSTQAADGAPAVNAKDRIGKGPWKNSKGVVVARDVADLHSAANNLSKQTSLSDVALVRLLAALCRSATSLATTTPLEFCHGPLPMRSRALTAGLPSAAWVDR